MKPSPLRTVFCILITALATTVFFVVAVLAMVLALDASASIWVARRLWSPTLIWAGGARVFVHGQENVDPLRPTIYVSNHQSTIDIPVLFVALPVNLRFLAKSQLRWVPFLGWYLWLAGHVFVNRSNRKSAVASLDRAAKRIRKGLSLIVFPEGTRSEDGSILPFKKGSFLLAMKAGVAVCPVTIEGSGRLMPKNSWKITPGEIHVTIGPPIDASKYDSEDRDRLISDVRTRVIEQSRSMGGKGGVVALLMLALACAGGGASKVDRRAEARAHIEQGDLDKAIPILESLHQKSPEDFDIARELTAAHVRKGNADVVLARARASVQRTQGRARAVQHYMAALAVFTRSGQGVDEAVRELESAIALIPEEAELHRRLGLVLLEAERFAPAAHALSTAKSLAPTSTTAALPLAKALYRSDQPEAAVAELRRLVEGEPTPKDIEVARDLMDRIADPFVEVPASVRPIIDEALVWLHDKDVPQEAIVRLETLAADFPDLGIVHALLGLALQKIDDAGRAIDALTRAVERSPKDGKPELYLGALYASRQRPEQAEQHYQRALALNPLLDPAWQYLGDLALQRQDFKKATHYLRVARNLEPNNVSTRAKLAQAFQRSGDADAADRELRAGLEAQPENVEFMLRLGLLHAERARAAKLGAQRKTSTKEASHWLRQVLSAQPDNALASRALESLPRN